MSYRFGIAVELHAVACGWLFGTTSPASAGLTLAADADASSTDLSTRSDVISPAILPRIQPWAVSQSFEKTGSPIGFGGREFGSIRIGSVCLEVGTPASFPGVALLPKECI